MKLTNYQILKSEIIFDSTTKIFSFRNGRGRIYRFYIYK